MATRPFLIRYSIWTLLRARRCWSESHYSFCSMHDCYTRCPSVIRTGEKRAALRWTDSTLIIDVAFDTVVPYSAYSSCYLCCGKSTPSMDEEDVSLKHTRGMRWTCDSKNHGFDFCRKLFTRIASPSSIIWYRSRGNDAHQREASRSWRRSRLHCMAICVYITMRHLQT